MLIQDVLSTITAAVVITESFFSYHPLRPFTGLFALSYFVYDSMMYKLKPDFLVHHVITSYILGIGYFYQFSDKIFSIICRIEISTFALNLIPYVKDQYKISVQLLFFILFFKFRIYDWYYMFIENKLSYVHAIPLLAFYTLNVYWFMIICKKMSKPLKNMNLTIVNHHICSYTLSINSMGIIYNLYPELSCVQFLSALLALTSYLYHKEIANYGIPNVYSIYKIFHVAAIHLSQSVYMYMLGGLFGKVSCYVHFINVMYIFDYLPDDMLSVSIPVFSIDFIYLLYTTQSIELFTLFLLGGLVYKMNVFYDLSFASIHLLLIWYSYYLSTNYETIVLNA